MIAEIRFFEIKFIKGTLRKKKKKKNKIKIEYSENDFLPRWDKTPSP